MNPVKTSLISNTLPQLQRFENVLDIKGIALKKDKNEKVFCVTFDHKPDADEAREQLCRELKQLIFSQDSTGDVADGWLDRAELDKVFTIQPNLMDFAPSFYVLGRGIKAQDLLDAAYASLTKDDFTMKPISNGHYMAIFKYV